MATLRLITRPARGLKSFLDVPGLYGVSLDEVIAQHRLPIDRDDAWDIATLAVDPSYRQGMLSLALFQVICTLARSAGVGALVSIVEVPVIRMIQAKFGSPFERFPGLDPVPYLGSPACVPVWTTGELLAQRVSAKDPELWDFLSLGEGLEPAFSRPEWAAFGASLRAATLEHRG
ncbi:MAG: hypothetical protein AB7L13_19220 [Acidimicrobiia bacterium]